MYLQSAADIGISKDLTIFDKDSTYFAFCKLYLLKSQKSFGAHPVFCLTIS